MLGLSFLTYEMVTRMHAIDLARVRPTRRDELRATGGHAADRPRVTLNGRLSFGKPARAQRETRMERAHTDRA